MKSATLFSINYLFPLFVFAQDSISTKNLQHLPVGVYLTQKSFYNKKPDIVKPLNAVVHYVKIKSPDTLISYGFQFQFEDSTKANLNAFAFNDGNNTYIQTEKNIFFKCAGFGMYPYLYVRQLKYGSGFPAVGLPLDFSQLLIESTVTGVLNASRKRKLYLHYFNKNRQLVKATPEAIGFLVKREKDLFEAYGNEPQKTEEVMLKYLDEMNKRYPTWEVK